MDENSRAQRDVFVLHLRQVEGLSIRQIARRMGMCTKTVSRAIREEGGSSRRKRDAGLMAPYARLVREWYTTHPRLKATQVFERLRSYGFAGAYPTVVKQTRSLRAKKPAMFHELELLPGEEAQVDWMVLTLPGQTLYGFVYILAWSRYLFVRFYPRMTFEFFLAGHLEAFRGNFGVPHAHRYDNLKSVVISRRPQLVLNPQFIDFSRHYGFTIHPCNPYRANEKGRVERVIRDIRSFLAIESFSTLQELNQLMDRWCRQRNAMVHRTTGRPPSDMVLEERLKVLPAIAYLPRRAITAAVSRTGFVEFETNRYSVPSRFSGQTCVILATAEQIEVVIGTSPVATHPRSFGIRQKQELPTHRQDLLKVTPLYRQQRILQLMTRMDPAVAKVLECSSDTLAGAHALFRLLVRHRKPMFLSAVREAILQKVFRIDYIANLLEKPLSPAPCPVTPQDGALLQITYEERRLDAYDQLG